MKRKHDIDNHKSRMTSKIIPLTLAFAVLVLTTQISSFEFIKPAMAADLSNMRVIPSTNVVNEKATYNILFTTATTGPIQFIVIVFPQTGVAITPSLIERSGIGPGFLTTIAGAQGPLLVYVVNNPVSIPAGTEIRLEIGSVPNLTTAGNLQLAVATFNTVPAILDGPTLSGADIKDITGNDISSSFMIKKTLKDDAAGQGHGWNPNGAIQSFIISDNDISGPRDSKFIDIITFGSGSCDPNFLIFDTQFGVFCEFSPSEGSELHYVITKLPEHVVTSSLSSSEPSSMSPFASSQDTGSINRQDETSSEFP